MKIIFTFIMAISLLTSCNFADITKTSTIEPEVTVVVPEYSRDFAHLNPCSWKDDGGPGCNGTSLTTCPDIGKYNSVVFIADDGRVIPMHFHNINRGRQQWTNYSWKGPKESRVAGYFLVKRGIESWKFRMNKPNGTYNDNTGTCFRQYKD